MSARRGFSTAREATLLTRRRQLKHLNKQKEGKKRLRAMSIGKIQIPQEAFSAVLRVDGLGGHRGKQ